MLTQERMDQFEYLLYKIFQFTKFGISVRDAGILSFFSTAEYYNKKEPTIRDMVTRCCKSNIDYFYNSIYDLFSGNSAKFKSKYYTYIPTNLHKKIDSIYNKFIASGINPPNEFPEEYIQFLKKFMKSSPDEKHVMLNMLSEN